VKKISIVDRRAWLFCGFLLCFLGSRNSTAQEQLTLLANAPQPKPGTIVGTVVDVNDDAIPRATVVLQGITLKSPRTLVSNDKGFFEFNGVGPETLSRHAQSEASRVSMLLNASFQRPASENAALAG
jgi:hypothetical protein